MEIGIFLAGFVIGAGAVWVYFMESADIAEGEPDTDPAGSGGPRPKPAGTDMEAQAAGGPRPKV